MQHAWSMRGTAYSEVMNMSAIERKLISKLSEENIETSHKSGLPFF